MTEIKVRECVREDMMDVFEMVRELAIFEKLEDQIEIDHTTLQRDGFDTTSPAFGCLIAEEISKITGESKSIGYAFFYNSYSSWLGKSIFLEDLYVKPNFRKQGTGKKLFLEVAKIAETLCCRMDFNVLTWNQNAIAFYKKLGAVCVTETEKWNLYRLSDEELKKAVKEI